MKSQTNTHTHTLVPLTGQGTAVIPTMLRAGRAGVRIPAGDILISKHVQTTSEAQPVFT